MAALCNEEQHGGSPYPSWKPPRCHELVACVDVAMDVISQNKGENLMFGTNRITHIRNGKKIEVLPIGIK